MCWNKKVVIGLIGAAVVVYFVAPGSVGSALPILLLAACPLSMVLMMKAMTGAKATTPETSEGAPPDRSTSDEISRLRAEVAELRRTVSAEPSPTIEARSTSGE